MSPPSKSSVVVSPRGQITLPSVLRKRLGVKAGGIITLEERGGEIVLRPAAVLEIEIYSDAEIADWDAQDNLEESIRAKLQQKLSKRS
ncbi:MAG: AbrB/MazE/SpoVT family DNA-binding domain-containing protein [Deltaproteobacteria bacterium]|nr:AbrB/MazE/SpoVT family DNA-binding domain-containing protein [Deltaproteobacteria bacterium]